MGVVKNLVNFDLINNSKEKKTECVKKLICENDKVARYNF